MPRKKAEVIVLEEEEEERAWIHRDSPRAHRHRGIPRRPPDIVIEEQKIEFGMGTPPWIKDKGHNDRHRQHNQHCGDRHQHRNHDHRHKAHDHDNLCCRIARKCMPDCMHKREDRLKDDNDARKYGTSALELTDGLTFSVEMPGTKT